MTSMKKLIAVLAVSLPLATLAQQAAPPAAPLYQIVRHPERQRAVLRGLEADRSRWSERRPAASASRSTRPTSASAARPTPASSASASSTSARPAATVDGSAPRRARPPVLCNRNSRLGLTHEYGTLFYGNWDSPYKAAWYGTKADDAFGNTDIYDAAGHHGQPGRQDHVDGGLAPLLAQPARRANAAAPSTVRAANTIAYHSPKFQGAQVKLQVTPNENATVDGTQTGNLYSAVVNYDRGPISVLAAWERHDDWAWPRRHRRHRLRRRPRTRSTRPSRSARATSTPTSTARPPSARCGST